MSANDNMYASSVVGWALAIGVLLGGVLGAIITWTVMQ